MAKIFGTPELQVSDLVKGRRNYDEKESSKNIKINERLGKVNFMNIIFIFIDF